MTAPSPRVRGLAAAVFGGAAFLFALAYTLLMPIPLMGFVGVHDGLYPLLWIGGFGVPAAAVVGALAGPRFAALRGPGQGAAAGLAVTVAAVALGVLLVSFVAMRPGGLLGHVAADNPAGFAVSPALVLQLVWPDVALLFLLPALPFGAVAGAAFVWLTRSSPAA